MFKNLFLLLTLFFFTSGIGGSHKAPLAGPAVEVGSIQWGRDLEQAKQASASSGKPLMLLFQEVPG